MGETFFISRAGADKEFARWLAHELRADGHSTILQDDNFGHADFMARMHDAFAAVDAGARVLALYSEHWFKSEYCVKEGMFPLTDDPFNKRNRFVGLRIEPVFPPGQFKGLAYSDVVVVRQSQGAAGVKEHVWRELGLIPRAAPSYPLPKYVGSFLDPSIRHNPLFAGREDVLDRIGLTLRPDRPLALANSQSAQALAGQGGVGKSELAREFACRTFGNYAGAWWLRAEKRETLVADLIEAASHLDASLAGVTETEKALPLALAVFEGISGKPWLLIYDNAERPEDIRELIPRAGVHALITTRWRDWHGVAQIEDIAVFPPEQGRDYLLANTGQNDAEGAARLSARLGHLPLALEGAAKYLRQTPTVSFDRYIENAGELLKSGPIHAVYMLALDRLENGVSEAGITAKPDADILMGLLSFMAPDSIPLYMFESIEPFKGLKLDEAAAALIGVSLASSAKLNDGRAALSVHRLVQEVVRDRLKDSGDYDDALGAALSVLTTAFPDDPADVRAWPECDRISPHAITASSIAQDDTPAFAYLDQVLYKLGALNSGRALRQAEEAFKRRSLRICELHYGTDHSATAVALSEVALFLQNVKRSDEAEPLMRRALSIGESSSSTRRRDVAVYLNNLASLLLETHRESDAEPLLRRALEITEALHGEVHPDIATGLNNLAQLLQNTNRFEEAEVLMRRALAMDEISYGVLHPNVGIRLSNLSVLLGYTARFEEALPLARRALDIFSASLPEGHPWLETMKVNLAAITSRSARSSLQSPPPSVVNAKPKRGLFDIIFRKRK